MKDSLTCTHIIFTLKSILVVCIPTPNKPMWLYLYTKSVHIAISWHKDSVSDYSISPHKVIIIADYVSTQG